MLIVTTLHVSVKDGYVSENYVMENFTKVTTNFPKYIFRIHVYTYSGFY